MKEIFLHCMIMSDLFLEGRMDGRVTNNSDEGQNLNSEDSSPVVTTSDGSPCADWGIVNHYMVLL